MPNDARGAAGQIAEHRPREPANDDSASEPDDEPQGGPAFFTRRVGAVGLGVVQTIFGGFGVDQTDRRGKVQVRDEVARDRQWPRLDAYPRHPAAQQRQKDDHRQDSWHG